MAEMIAASDLERMHEAGMDPEHLREAGRRDAANWQVMHQVQEAAHLQHWISGLESRMDRLFAELDRLPTTGYSGPNPLLEIRENPRLFRAIIADAHTLQRKRKLLPTVQTADGAPPKMRIAVVAGAYLDAAHSVWDASGLRVYVNAAQTIDPLRLEELWALASMLKLVLLERILAQAEALLRSGADAGTAADAPLLTTRIKSLRELGYSDWPSVAESMTPFEELLRQDPAMAYARMDFDSREVYRKQVSKLARSSGASEVQVVEAALALAQEAQRHPIDDPRLYLRQAHIGYYLFEEGFAPLSRRIDYRPRWIDRLRRIVRRNADDFYIGGIELVSIALIALILIPLVPSYPVFLKIAFAFVLLLLPVTQGAVDLVNNSLSSLFDPLPLPKLDFSAGIPAEHTTMVAVPTLLLNEAQVRELVRDLEVRMLANPDPHLHFALLTDLPDSVAKPREHDIDPLVELAIKLIEELNARYTRYDKHGGFVLLHRHRLFNARQGVWMGWERKRGKLLDLNKLLRGEFDAFPVKAGHLQVLPEVKYIVTLDSDTQLPRGTAHSLVGAITHPLNRAIIDPQRRVVTRGYGILQPRVGVSVHSASRSRLAALYSGQTGFDIYTRAVSDVYQDIYGEGIFTGKGIYEVSTLHAVLDRRFPRNFLLSHDLIEGAYARAGLASDIEIIDDYPTHYSAYTRRKHRWVRGDWQIMQWLFARVPDEAGHSVRNPISTISRWKILDNLRRSLVEPSTMVLLVAGWLGLPGGATYWTLVTLFLLFVPNFLQLAFGIGRSFFIDQQGLIGEAFRGFAQSVLVTVLNLAFLPHQTMLAFDAIIRSLVRRFITGQRLLEWETAAEAESGAQRTSTIDRYLKYTPLVTVALTVLVALFHPEALLIAAPILLLWYFESSIMRWLNQPPRPVRAQLRPSDDSFLREQALRVWRFFHEFGEARHNYLIPDNVEEEGLFEAARVSPTNLGLLFNARQAAVEFGFLTAPEYCEKMQRSYATIAKLPKLNGHLYNWYNTHTLEPLLPITVSSVDSGNLMASLYTVHSGTVWLLQQPLLRRSAFLGVLVHLDLLRKLKGVPAAIAGLQAPGANASMEDWFGWLFQAKTYAAFEQLPEYGEPSPDEVAWWTNETRARILALQRLVAEYLPWLHPDFAELRRELFPEVAVERLIPTIEQADDFLTDLEIRLQGSREDDNSQREVFSEVIESTRRNYRALTDAVESVAGEAFRLAEEMDLAFLVDKGRQLLSIGYELAPQKLHKACYDMLASEARIATFIAVARGELSQQGWFKMSRTHTSAYGCWVLLSWTGTTFEYLMPSLWMQSYPDTLITRSMENAVEIHRNFGRENKIPWGISESGYAKKDDAGHYHYQAWGVPQISLKWDAEAGPVVSPYSTFLALGVAPDAAIQNLRFQASKGWVGAYGFYEAIDYSQSVRSPIPVKEWMAHHQGMSILAVLNALCDNRMQQWFHANAQMQSVELLLHEKPIRTAILKAESQKLGPKKKPAVT